MDIGIDAGPVLGRGGISRYVGPLVRRLVELDAETTYHLVVRRSWLRRGAAAELAAIAPVVPLAVPDRVLSAWWRCVPASFPFPRRFWDGLDAYLATCLFAPRLPRGRVVSIVYDLIPLKLPELFPDHERFRRRIGTLVARSRALVAISRRTRDDLVELFDVAPDRVSVIPPGPDETFRPAREDEIRSVKEGHRIRGDYILYVGSLGPHKDVGCLLRAFSRSRLDGTPALELVLAGDTRWAGEALRREMSSNGRVRLLGAVSDRDLRALYSGALAFVFPSRYEGFGLPVLEAMACGAPVVSSRGGALPEVAGEAAVLYPPQDEQALAAALEKVVGDAALRESLSQAGVSRARQFSWRASAARLAEVLRGESEA